MNIGDVIENGVWLDGTETPDQRTAYEAMVTEAIDDFCRDMRLVRGPVSFTEKRPGADRVPPVPPHIEKKATDLTRITLLVIEATITGYVVQTTPARFVDNLDVKDLRRLRLMTRRAHLKNNPTEALLTDAECDQIIETIGPDAAVDSLRRETVVSRFH